MNDKLAEGASILIESTCNGIALSNWLEENYKWPNTPNKRIDLYKKFNHEFRIPRGKQCIHLDDMGCYQKTIKIKNYISRALQENVSDDERLNLIEFFIKDWGGITNARETLKKIILTRSNMNGANDQLFLYRDSNNRERIFNRYTLSTNGILCSAGVSSWSKYLSIVYPDWAHIYDTRVAYSLNAIIYLYNIHESMLWPMPSGRNSRINLLDIETLILSSQIEERKLSLLMDRVSAREITVSEFRRNYYIDDEKVYSTYLNLLKLIKSKLNTRGKTNCSNSNEIESFLFSMADTEIFRLVREKLDN